MVAAERQLVVHPNLGHLPPPAARQRRSDGEPKKRQRAPDDRRRTLTCCFAERCSTSSGTRRDALSAIDIASQFADRIAEEPFAAAESSPPRGAAPARHPLRINAALRSRPPRKVVGGLEVTQPPTSAARARPPSAITFAVPAPASSRRRFEAYIIARAELRGARSTSSRAPTCSGSVTGVLTQGPTLDLRDERPDAEPTASSNRAAAPQRPALC